MEGLPELCYSHLFWCHILPRLPALLLLTNTRLIYPDLRNFSHLRQKAPTMEQLSKPNRMNYDEDDLTGQKANNLSTKTMVNITATRHCCSDHLTLLSQTFLSASQRMDPWKITPWKVLLLSLATSSTQTISPSPTVMSLKTWMMQDKTLKGKLQLSKFKYFQIPSGNARNLQAPSQPFQRSQTLDSTHCTSCIRIGIS